MCNYAVVSLFRLREHKEVFISSKNISCISFKRDNEHIRMDELLTFKFFFLYQKIFAATTKISKENASLYIFIARKINSMKL